MDTLKPGFILEGHAFPEPIEVITIINIGEKVKVIGKGKRSNKVYEPVLTKEQIESLNVSTGKSDYLGDSNKFRLGIESLRLALAYEYDPYFTLSIARVDPLPHQLEAVYDYFLKLPRVRFLLADDPGAGKTIMAGLLIKELKIRGLIKRILIITPANLSFQWQRELKDKFREKFEIVNGGVLRATYGSNPWQEKNQVITSVTWISTRDDAKDSLLRSEWDLIVVDEAHKMSAYDKDHKTLAYQLGEAMSDKTDHFLMMTATPHKGDPDNFCLFLELLDKDVYGNVKSLEEAIKRNNAPFYLRRTKELLVTFPDPETGQVKKLFTKRNVQTIEFRIDDEEYDFYDSLTKYVEDQSIKADETAKGRALSFTMAMLQKRFASSIRAVRKSLERMRDKRQRILDDPEAYMQEIRERKMPEDYEDLPEDEKQEFEEQLEQIVASIDPAALKEEIADLSRLIDQARYLEKKEVESKLCKLKDVLSDQGIFKDPTMKLLIFTEHKDTLDYLVEKLHEWGLVTTQIHGSMKIGDRDTPGTRIYAEREFRESAQILVATEAAGEGINLQFCWFMVNYDIPWNPMRLEQRMGRIHRYGQERDCLILNFVSTNTREGKVLVKLLERLEKIEKDLDPERTGKVFNVLGDIYPPNHIEKMIRDMYARNLTDAAIIERIVEDIDTDKFKQITSSTLEGLAKKDLNLSAIIGKSIEAKERRLVPEVIEDFFKEAAKITGIDTKEIQPHFYRIDRISRALITKGEEIESRFGKLGKSFKQFVFDKKLLRDDATSEWVTPGHPLFEAIRMCTFDVASKEFERGSIFYDVHSKELYKLDVFAASIKDGRSNCIHRKLFVVQSNKDSSMIVKQPTIFLDLALANKKTEIPNIEFASNQDTEHYLIKTALEPFLQEVSKEREKEIDTISRHVEISLNEIINKMQLQYASLEQERSSGAQTQGLDGRIKQVEEKLDELNARLEDRREKLKKERHCVIDNIDHIGSALVLPHPERASMVIGPMVKDDEIEKTAVEYAIKHEKENGWIVESVEADNRGFDLISKKPHPEDPNAYAEIKFIEVKGRSEVGEIALTNNEYKTAERLQKDYWLYVVYNCASEPKMHKVQDPARLNWQPLVKIEHYHVKSQEIIGAEQN